MFKWIKWAFIALKLWIFPPRQKDINIDKMGLNAFYNDPAFGTMREQSKEIREVLGIRSVRILFHWDEHIQKAEHMPINWSFIQDVVDAIPEGMDALMVVNGVPKWLEEYPGNKKQAFYDMFKRVCYKFKDNPKIVGYQVWNEPNIPEAEKNEVMGWKNDPAEYVQLVKKCYEISKEIDKNKAIVSAATTSINQNYPKTLEYNKKMVENGILDVIDCYGLHWYGESFELLHRPNGILEFLKSFKKQIWMTESGEEGLGKQKKYVRRAWPYLRKLLSHRLHRIYYYIYYGGDFGLKQKDGEEIRVSDLLVYLQEKNKDE